MLRAVRASARTIQWNADSGVGARTTILDSPDGRTLPGDIFTREMVQLWFALRRRPWMSIAVVPAQHDGSALALSRRLAEVGSAEIGEPIELIDASGAVLRNVPERVHRIQRHVAGGGTVIVGMPSVSEEPAGLPVAASVDACVLCVALGRSDLTTARRNVELIGRHRFLGSVTVREASRTLARAIHRTEAAFFGGRA